MTLDKQTFSNRQALADLNEMREIALEIEQRGANKNRILDLDLRVQMRVVVRVVEWLGEYKVKHPLRPLGPALARLARRASKLSTRSIGRADRDVCELQSTARMTIREALQERIAAGDVQAAEALHVFEAWAPERLGALSADCNDEHGDYHRRPAAGREARR
jgi:hypothetical protein